MSTIYEVAKLAGCAVSTVSRVLNHHPNVSAKTKAKVQTAMDKLQYRPNTVAKSLASQRTHCVGVMVNELASSFFGTLTGAIESTMRAHNKHTIVTAGHSDAATEKKGIEFLIDRKCDAIVVHAEAVSDAYLIELIERGVAMLVVNREIKGYESYCISLDNELGGFLATQAVIAHGHKDIAYIGGPMKKHDAHQRWEGHRRALEDANIDYNPLNFIEAEFTKSEGEAAFHRLFKRKAVFSAIVCGNDEIACGVITAARLHGLALPDQLSIVGFDNSPITLCTYPTLTTIDYPIAQMGQYAANHILQTVYGEQIDCDSGLFKPQLVERASLIESPSVE